MTDQRDEPTYPMYLGTYNDFALSLSRSGMVTATRDDEEVTSIEEPSVRAVRLAIDNIVQKEAEAAARQQRSEQSQPAVLVMRDHNRDGDVVYQCLLGQVRGVVAGTYDRRVRVETSQGRTQVHTTHVIALLPVDDSRVQVVKRMLREYSDLQAQLREVAHQLDEVCKTCPQFTGSSFGRPLSKSDALDVEAAMFTALRQLVPGCAPFTVEV